MQQNVQAIILAAGSSSRMNTDRSKLAEPICGRPMITYSTHLMTQTLNLDTTLIVGHQKKLILSLVKSYKHPVTHTEQKQQRGTGDAVACSQSQWHKDHILIINGDMPLITKEIISLLYQKHITTDAAISFVIAQHTAPDAGYGRIMQDGSTVTIVEAKEFQGDYEKYRFVNAGIYLVKKAFLKDSISCLQKNTVSQEYHITDLVAYAQTLGYTTTMVEAPFDAIQGVNTLAELLAVEKTKRRHLMDYWMQRGVRFLDDTIYIDCDVHIDPGVIVEPGVQLHGKTSIGKNSIIQAGSCIKDSSIGNDCIIEPYTIIKSSKIEDNTSVGPLAHIQNSTVKKDTVIGNFVEIKRSTVGDRSKIKHLSYIGDTSIAQEVNIGAGTITCNFDGNRKHKTIIKDRVFVGSNNTIVAPVTIHEGSFTAAGSVITNDVPKKSLAIARARQINKLDYFEKKKDTKMGILPKKTANSESHL